MTVGQLQRELDQNPDGGLEEWRDWKALNLVEAAEAEHEAKKIKEGFK